MTSLTQPRPDLPEQTEAAVDGRITTRSAGIYWFILVVAAALLVLLPEQAAWINTRRGWYTQPMLGPLLGLSLLVIFTGARLLCSFRLSQFRWKNLDPVEALLQAAGNYRVTLFSSVLFFLYINTLSIFGFALASLMFVCTLLWLSRLLDRFWFICSLGTIVLLILIFRVGVNVWLPDVWLYDLLPQQWANFANQYL